MFVCHACDNPRCVRVDHLFIGSAHDNNRDRALKGRSSTHGNRRRRTKPRAKKTRGNPNGNPAIIAVGSANVSAKLTDEAVRRIRELQGKLTTREAAAVHGVSATVVSKIWRRIYWSHVV